MQAIYQHLPFPRDSYLNFYVEDLPHFVVSWHYHPEIEIMYITRGYGTRYVGDNIGGYQVGDICVVGPNLQHEWRSDEAFFSNDPALRAVCKVIFFRKEVFDSNMAYLPEMASIRGLLERSGRGILFEGGSRERLGRVIDRIHAATGMARFTGLIELLEMMSAEEEYRLLSSDDFGKSVDTKDFSRFNRVCEYLLKNYTRDVQLGDAAGIVGLTPQAFCKYFKARTGMTFVRYLNNMRIGYAKKMLIDGRYKISVVCHEAGFNNQSHFIRQFRQSTGMLPSEFQERHKAQ